MRHTENVESYTAPDKSRRFATRVKFIPHTGRTHQLRLAAADPHGFSVPIIGDTLYGKCEKGERLLLHSSKLTFEHPVTKEKMNFISKPPFQRVFPLESMRLIPFPEYFRRFF